MNDGDQRLNLKLLANAGSGKTHELVTRMIRLLLDGFEPDRIAALTFTRKSAGEFLDKLLERLAHAATDPNALDKLRADTASTTLTSADCTSLLARITTRIGRLGMGTIDSLFARIARAFPLESGLAEDFTIADKPDIDAARIAALARQFQVSSRGGDAMAPLVDQFRRIIQKNGERHVFATLLGEIDRLHHLFLEHDVPWGDARAIWPDGCDILAAGPIPQAADDFLRAVLDTHPDLGGEAREKLANEAANLKILADARPWNAEAKKFITSRLCAEPKDGDLRITPKKSGWVTLNGTVRAARSRLLAAVLKPAFENLLARADGLRRFLAGFDAAYAALAREAGLVTFGDITSLLARRAGGLADAETAAVWRATVGFRIDQTFDHWLLDEFQDTSRLQWQVLKAFIDEVVQDDAGQRTFFYVGDIKQAIYGWRGGDSDLFNEIERGSNGGIQPADPLARSWRSTQPVIDMVNRVFGGIAAAADDLGWSDRVVDKWRRGWQEHACARADAGIGGHAEWIEVEKDDAGDEADPQQEAVLRVIVDANPLAHGETCAVLMRTNKQVGEMAAHLRQSGVPVAVEGKSNPCLDNPLGAALVAALRVAANPDDALSLAVADGFAPGWLFDEGESRPHAFRRRTLASLATHGFAATLREWMRTLPLGTDAFLLSRSGEVLAAAGEFDARRTPAQGIPEFLAFMESRQTQEAEAGGVIRLMTVHQAKGLDFDMVVVAGLDGRSAGQTANELVLGPDRKAPKWGMLLPGREIAQCDGVLHRQADILRDTANYESLCTAYVALTRAKSRLFVVTNKLGENTTTKNFARLLMVTLGGTKSFGDPAWAPSPAVTTMAMPTQAPTPAPPDFATPIHNSPQPESPSSLAGDTDEAAGHGAGNPAATALGTDVHALLAKIEWLDADSPNAPSADTEAARLVRDFLAGDLAKSALAKPSAPCLLWRERAFDTLIDGTWLSGVFDRVHVALDDLGIPVSATILDYKTDRNTRGLDAKYSAQLDAYRRAASQILDIPTDSISAHTLPIRR